MPRKFIIVTLMLLPALLVLSQGAKTNLLFSNVPSCPLFVQVRPGGDKLLITNRSSHPVTAYKWGCISEASGQFRLVKPLRAEHQQFGAARSGVEADTWGDFVSAYQHDFKQCSNNSATLAVIQVSFEDGGEWVLR